MRRGKWTGGGDDQSSRWAGPGRLIEHQSVFIETGGGHTSLADSASDMGLPYIYTLLYYPNLDNIAARPNFTSTYRGVNVRLA